MKTNVFKYIDIYLKESFGGAKNPPKNKMMKTSIASINQGKNNKPKSNIPSTKDTMKSHSSFSNRYTPKKN